MKGGSGTLYSVLRPYFSNWGADITKAIWWWLRGHDNPTSITLEVKMYINFSLYSGNFLLAHHIKATTSSYLILQVVFNQMSCWSHRIYKTKYTYFCFSPLNSLIMQKHRKLFSVYVCVIWHLLFSFILKHRDLKLENICQWLKTGSFKH